MSRIQEIRNEIDALQSKIEAIQEACSHPPIVLDVETDRYCITPEYDSLATKSYRTTNSYYCGLCEKSWSTSEVTS